MVEQALYASLTLFGCAAIKAIYELNKFKK